MKLLYIHRSEFLFLDSDYTRFIDAEGTIYEYCVVIFYESKMLL